MAARMEPTCPPLFLESLPTFTRRRRNCTVCLQRPHVVCLLLVLRVSVLYRHAIQVRLAVWGIALALLGVACWAVSGPGGFVVQNPLVAGCHIALSREVGIRTAVAWEAQAAFDIVAVVLTAYASWRTHRESQAAKGSMIVNVLLRDGAIYFVVMAAANLANILTFIISPPILKGVLSTLASSISISMMSRLILRLHDAALGSPSTTLIDQPLEQMPSVGMVFATSFEAVDDDLTDEEGEYSSCSCE
ncbi:hypothetical protein PENSPDRAFT_197901 [Peniophora sp. CONT]|nr:hypothetical protein PENSPDRAFT_197901 [Peniophora sp. CONT]